MIALEYRLIVSF